MRHRRLTWCHLSAQLINVYHGVSSPPLISTVLRTVSSFVRGFSTHWVHPMGFSTSSSSQLGRRVGGHWVWVKSALHFLSYFRWRQEGVIHPTPRTELVSLTQSLSSEFYGCQIWPLMHHFFSLIRTRERRILAPTRSIACLSWESLEILQWCAPSQLSSWCLWRAIYPRIFVVQGGICTSLCKSLDEDLIQEHMSLQRLIRPREECFDTNKSKQSPIWNETWAFSFLSERSEE